MQYTCILKHHVDDTAVQFGLSEIDCHGKRHSLKMGIREATELRKVEEKVIQHSPSPKS